MRDDLLTHRTYSKGKKLVPHRSTAVNVSDTAMMAEISLMYLTSLFKHLLGAPGRWVDRRWIKNADNMSGTPYWKRRKNEWQENWERELLIIQQSGPVAVSERTSGARLIVDVTNHGVWHSMTPRCLRVKTRTLARRPTGWELCHAIIQYMFEQEGCNENWCAKPLPLLGYCCYDCQAFAPVTSNTEFSICQ